MNHVSQISAHHSDMPMLGKLLHGARRLISKKTLALLALLGIAVGAGEMWSEYSKYRLYQDPNLSGAVNEAVAKLAQEGYQVTDVDVESYLGKGVLEIEAYRGHVEHHVIMSYPKLGVWYRMPTNPVAWLLPSYVPYVHDPEDLLLSHDDLSIGAQMSAQESADFEQALVFEDAKSGLSGDEPTQDLALQDLTLTQPDLAKPSDSLSPSVAAQSPQYLNLPAASLQTQPTIHPDTAQ